ncbi:hypothetical protein [Acaryochloris sp. CCMEE 5410]|uniref:hypothetical protein n=1 Tax=Acaryochloris sp. CCMEE 5410 TaxID=310037 RepID=UPI00024848D1|nr:hypothetical protein [Acaryochloris sp. CCMEE 5410]KAI9129832.1 hypothetical protein ON05_032430 [Acaryochloris sp. CCMEE 5410]
MADTIHEHNELGQHIWSLKNLTEQTKAAAKRAEQHSRSIGQVSLTQKLLDIQRQLCILQLRLKDSEIQEWTGEQMHIPF